MMVNPVIICDHEDVTAKLPDVSSKAGFELGKVKVALVKPNLCGLYHPTSNLLYSIVEFLLSGAESVLVGETRSMMHDPERQFEELGVNALLKRFNERARAVDLSKDDWVKVPVPNPHALKGINLPKTVIDSGVLVNVPKVGSHSTTRLTCALKNLFGLLPQKQKYMEYHHLGVDNVIADIAQVVKPDLNIVDARSKAVIGVDALAVDAVACKFLNLDPMKVEHLRLVSEDRGEKLRDFVRSLRVIEV